MDRRDFIKKSAVAAATTAIATPVMAMLTKAEQTGLASEEAEPVKMSRPDGLAPKVLQKIHANGNTAPKRDEKHVFMNFIR